MISLVSCGPGGPVSWQCLVFVGPKGHTASPDKFPVSLGQGMRGCKSIGCHSRTFGIRAARSPLALAQPSRN